MGEGGELSGRRVLVTGASSGIGAATCRTIVARGGAVAMVARRRERLEELAAELGDSAVSVPADLTDLDQLAASIKAGADALGGLDGVIAVAGQMMTGAMASGTPEKWPALVDLNLIGPLATVRYALEHFAPIGRRDVVIIGSTGALTPMAGVGIYGASKRGLEAAFDSLRLELAPSGVNVSLVMPGMFETEGLTLEGIVIDGEVVGGDIPYFAEGGLPGSPSALADCIAFMIGMPEGICIHEMVVRPTSQLNP
jgi:NADP-dependent 3-hydroxy acid dehydrogenase YdfG